MDPISDILSHLDFSGMLYYATEFSGDWGVRVPEYSNVIRFHLVLRGTCYVRVCEDGTAHQIKPGDFFMIPHGASHDLLAHPDLPTPPLETVLRDLGYSGEGPLVIRLDDTGEPVRLLCGHFSFTPSARGNTFLKNLPSHIVAREMPGKASEWITSTLDLLAQEAHQPAPGHNLVIHRMTEVLFVQALRLWMRQSDLPAGVLRGLNDMQLSRAISAMHADPGHPWTVENLAREAGYSRSVFAERFQQLTGTSPLRYLTEWRMQKAHRMLAAEGRSVDDVALAVGYQSGPAFSRVFSRHFGEGPGRIRRQARHPDELSVNPDLHA